MKRNLKEFALYFSLQCLSYGVLCWNFRAIAQARFGSIVASDMLCAAISFKLIKKVAEAKCNWALTGYILGGAVGSVISVYITRKVFGQ